MSNLCVIKYVLALMLLPAILSTAAERKWPILPLCGETLLKKSQQIKLVRSVEEKVYEKLQRLRLIPPILAHNGDVARYMERKGYASTDADIESIVTGIQLNIGYRPGLDGKDQIELYPTFRVIDDVFGYSVVNRDAYFRVMISNAVNADGSEASTGSLLARNFAVIVTPMQEQWLSRVFSSRENDSLPVARNSLSVARNDLSAMSQGGSIWDIYSVGLWSDVTEAELMAVIRILFIESAFIKTIPKEKLDPKTAGPYMQAQAFVYSMVPALNENRIQAKWRGHTGSLLLSPGPRPRRTK